MALEARYRKKVGDDSNSPAVMGEVNNPRERASGSLKAGDCNLLGHVELSKIET